MSKKKTKMTHEQTQNSKEQAVVELEQTQEPLIVADKQSAEKKQENKVTKKQKEKKPNKLVTSIKETASELKKVTWPTFRKVVKQTSTVLAVVFIFGIVLFGIDRLLSLLFDVLVSAL